MTHADIDTSTVIIERRDEIALLIFNRPEKLNAMNTDMSDMIPRRVQEICDDDSIRAVVITGNGRAFSAGADLSPEAQAKIHGPERDANRRWRAHNVFDPRSGWPRSWIGATIPCPVVAAINGPAAGFAAEIIVSADYRIAGESGRVGWTFAKRGMITDHAAGPFLLPRIVGPAVAARLLFSGEVVGAAEMLRIGLVNEVVPDDQLRDRAVEIARHLAEGAPSAVRMLKRQIHTSMTSDPRSMYVQNLPAFNASMNSDDFKEGVAAFLEKRPPRWPDPQ
jgi:enoyl-CoA hydratase/carnithine racemase